MNRIFITDDHTMVRDALVKVLEFTKNNIVVGVAGTGAECLEKIEEIKPSTLLLDINLPDMSGIEVLRIAKEKYPELKVIMLTVHDDYAYAADAMKSGADGYLLKDSDVETLEKALEVVHAGEKFVVQQVKNLLQMKVRVDGSDEVLTLRELQVLNLLAEGFSNKAIADELGVSEKTVKNHLSSIFRKIEVSDRTNAVIYALKNRAK